MPGIGGRLGGRVEEQVRPRFAACRAVRELVDGIEVSIESEQRHDRVVVALGRGEIGDVDTEMAEHSAIPSRWGGSPAGGPMTRRLAGHEAQPETRCGSSQWRGPTARGYCN